MVKIKGKSSFSATGRLPILLIAQVITVAVVILYVPFLIRRTTIDVVPSSVLTLTNPPGVRNILSIDSNSNNGDGLSKRSENIQIGSAKDTGLDATVIGYAVSVTGCGSDPLTEGAAVLKHSIHLTSIHGNMGGKYDYKMYAIYHPRAADCSAALAELGYELLERNTPVAVADIEGDFLRSKIRENGCCGKEFWVLFMTII